MTSPIPDTRPTWKEVQRRLAKAGVLEKPKQLRTEKPKTGEHHKTPVEGRRPGERWKRYPSIRDAAKAVGVSDAAVGHACRGRSATAAGM